MIAQEERLGGSSFNRRGPLYDDALAVVRGLVQIWQRLKIPREPETARLEVPLFRFHGYPPAPFPLARFSGGVTPGERIQDQVSGLRQEVRGSHRLLQTETASNRVFDSLEHRPAD